CRQQPVPVQVFDDLGAARPSPEPPALPWWAPTATACIGAASASTATHISAAIVTPRPVATTDPLQQLRIDPGRVRDPGSRRDLIREEVVQALADHHVLPQRNRSVLL